jgi:hypothetical protein
MPDTKISAAAGETGGTAETADLTTLFLRKDNVEATPFSSIPATVPPTPSGAVSGYSALGGDVTTGGGGMLGVVNAQGLTGLHPVTIPGSLLVAASTLASFTTAASIASGSIPAGDPVAGAVYVLKCSGIYSSTGTPTFLFAANYGSTAIAAFDTAITTGSSVTQQSWEAEFVLQFYSTVLAAGVLRLTWGTSTSTDAASTYLVSSGNANGGAGTTAITVASATAKTINLTVACSASNASNTISALTCYAQRVA